MTTPPDSELRAVWRALDRYLTGEAGEPEAADVQMRLAEAPRLRVLAEAMRAAVRPGMGVAPPGDDVAWARLRADIEAARPAGDAPTVVAAPRPSDVLSVRWRRAPRPLQPVLWGSVLAVALILFGALGRTVSRTSPPVLPAKTYTTRAGQRAEIRLPDGIAVTLTPQTSLSMAAGFGRTHRTVRIVGQAYFDVPSQTNLPFIVRAGGVTSRVLGTQFVVRHYPTDRDVFVSVKSGKVSTGRETAVVVTANNSARVTDSTVIVTADTALREMMEWSNGRLVFKDAPVLEVATVIGQWYGLTFRFADSSLVHKNLTGAFGDRDSQQDVLQSLQIMLGVKMNFDGNVVTLVPKRRSPVRHRDTTPGTHATYKEVGR